jgi:hydrogenase maturation protease
LTEKIPKILIYGYGNPGRQDDGLGVQLAAELEKWCADNHYKHVHTDSNYQLNLEDADLISGYQCVIFADASKEDISDFYFQPLEPSEKVEFTMHAVSPAFVLHLCGQIFNCRPETYLMHIRGYEWEFTEGITGRAQHNLLKAVEYVKRFIIDRIKPVSLIDV